MTDEYQQVIDRLKEDGYDDEAEILEKYSKGQLREKAGQAAKLQQERDDLVARIKVLEDAPKRREVLQKIGVELDSLRPAEIELLDRASAEEYTEEWARSVVEKYQLPVKENSGDAGAADINASQFGTPGGPAGQTAKGGAASGVLTPAVYSDWPVEKRMRFLEWAEKNRPDAVAALDDGESVSGITFA